MIDFVQNWCVPTTDFLPAELVTPYYCLYVGTNLVELYNLGVTDFASGFCTADLTLRQTLIERMYDGEDCLTVLTDLNYTESQAKVYDPLSQELSQAEICGYFQETVDMLVGVGMSSSVDGLRFSYEVSFTEDSEAQEFLAYSQCVETDAREHPLAVCEAMMSAYPDHFALLNDS